MITSLKGCRKKWHVKDKCFIRCQLCKKESFERKYYQTKNHLYLHVACYEKAKAEEGPSIKVYDTGPKFIDRYTVFIGGHVFGMSSNACSPNGFNQYIGAGNDTEFKGTKHFLGKQVQLKGLPREVLDAITQRVNDK